MLSISELLDGEKVYYKKYRNELLYNIILEKEGLMKVNNMVVETLDPKTLIAKVFNGSLSEEQRNKVIKSIKEHHERVKKV